MFRASSWAPVFSTSTLKLGMRFKLRHRSLTLDVKEHDREALHRRLHHGNEGAPEAVALQHRLKEPPRWPPQVGDDRPSAASRDLDATLGE